MCEKFLFQYGARAAANWCLLWLSKYKLKGEFCLDKNHDNSFMPSLVGLTFFLLMNSYCKYKKKIRKTNEGGGGLMNGHEYSSFSLFAEVHC